MNMRARRLLARLYAGVMVLSVAFLGVLEWSAWTGFQSAPDNRIGFALWAWPRIVAFEIAESLNHWAGWSKHSLFGVMMVASAIALLVMVCAFLAIVREVRSWPPASLLRDTNRAA